MAVAGDGRWHPVGTAFVIGSPNLRSAILLTAAHNVEYARSLERRGQWHHPTIAPEFRPPPEDWVNLTRTQIFVLLPEHQPMPAAAVARCWYSDIIDVAVLFAVAGEEDQPPFGERLAIDTRPVPIGTELVAVGYPGTTADFSAKPDYEAQRFAGQIQFQLHTRGGVVTDVHPQGIGIHAGPGFSMSVPFDSGMSGGPLLDLTVAPPCVRGVVGSDFSTDVTDGALGSAVQAFASALWPAMAIRTQLTVVDKDSAALTPVGATLLDLVKSQVVDDVGRADLHVRVKTEAGKRVVSWEP
jgi:hypothetical protein